MGEYFRASTNLTRLAPCVGQSPEEVVEVVLEVDLPQLPRPSRCPSNDGCGPPGRLRAALQPLVGTHFGRMPWRRYSARRLAPSRRASSTNSRRGDMASCSLEGMVQLRVSIFPTPYPCLRSVPACKDKGTCPARLPAPRQPRRQATCIFLSLADSWHESGKFMEGSKSERLRFADLCRGAELVENSLAS